MRLSARSKSQLWRTRLGQRLRKCPTLKSTLEECMINRPSLSGKYRGTTKKKRGRSPQRLSTQLWHKFWTKFNWSSNRKNGGNYRHGSCWSSIMSGWSALKNLSSSWPSTASRKLIKLGLANTMLKKNYWKIWRIADVIYSISLRLRSHARSTLCKTCSSGLTFKFRGWRTRFTWTN